MFKKSKRDDRTQDTSEMDAKGKHTIAEITAQFDRAFDLCDSDLCPNPMLHNQWKSFQGEILAQFGFTCRDTAARNRRVKDANYDFWMNRILQPHFDRLKKTE